MSIPDLSIVIPVKDEEDNIKPLVQELTSILGCDPTKLEILFVDDGSTDNTLLHIHQAAVENPCIQWISFDRNYGQTSAFDAGLRAARGKLLALIDGDLQNDPADIPAMIEKLQSADLVCGYRRKRQDNLVRRVCSKSANRIRNWITREDVIDGGCSLKVMRRECIENVKLMEGMHRFFPTLVKMEGFKVVQMPVNHRPRLHCRTKYGISNRLFKVLVDLMAVRWMQYRHLKYRIKERK